MSNSAERPQSFLSRPPKTRAFVDSVLFALIAAVVSIAAWRSEPIKDLLMEGPQKVVTSLFLHSDIHHLLANLFFLIPFGGLLTNYYGRWVFPVMGIVLGIATQFLSLKTYPLEMNLMGASGLLYVLFGLWLALFYRAEFHLPRTTRWFRILGFGLVMFIPSQVEQTVSYRTHYIGLAIGLAAGIIYGFLKRREFERRNRPYVIASITHRAL